MSEITNAEKHAEIASGVYPDAEVVLGHPLSPNAVRVEYYEEGVEGSDQIHRFDLLEVDEHGNPTQQAKASAFDTLAWLDSIDTDDPTSEMSTYAEWTVVCLGLDCESIFNKAYEIVK